MDIPYINIVKTIAERFEGAEVDRTQDLKFGDYYTNLAFKMAKDYKKPPKVIAEEIAKSINIEGVSSEVSGGYINFKLNDDTLLRFINQMAKGIDLSKNLNTSILVEFISANPTGPLNVANARAGAIGEAIVRVLRFLGYKVHSEYYVNDAGSQIINLALSVLHHIDKDRYEFPEGGYRGDYIKSLAEVFKDKYRGDIETFGREISHKILESQKDTLRRYGIEFDNFVFESEIRSSEYPDMVIKALYEKNLIYYQDKEGKTFKVEEGSLKDVIDRCKNGYALMFKSSNFGDDKDRVLIRSNGEPTYFFWDSAYHLHKLFRNYDILIDIWGPDHYGYVPRMKAMIEALKEYYKLGSQFVVIIHGQVNLYEDGKMMRMSKREGKIYTLDDLLDDVGKDAVRFFMLLRSPSSELNFDISLARKFEKENPVYYTQYAHARISSLLDYARENGIKPSEIREFSNEDERILGRILQFFPYYILKVLPLPLRNSYIFDRYYEVSADFSPNLLVDYLIELSHTYHKFYQNNRIVGSGRDGERLTLSLAVMNVIREGLNLIGVDAPKRMVKA